MHFYLLYDLPTDKLLIENSHTLHIKAQQGIFSNYTLTFFLLKLLLLIPYIYI